MNKPWEDIKQGVRHGISTAAEKVELMARIAKAKLEISTVKRDLADAAGQLGRHVYGLVKNHKAEIGKDEEVKRLTQRISTLESDLEEAQARLEEIRREREVDRDPRVPPAREGP